MEALAAEMGMDIDNTSKEETDGDKLASPKDTGQGGDDVEVKKEQKSGGGPPTLSGEGGKIGGGPPTVSGGGGKSRGSPPTVSSGGGKKSKKKKKKGDIEYVFLNLVSNFDMSGCNYCSDEELESMLRDIEGEEPVNGTTKSPPSVLAEQVSAGNESEQTSEVAVGGVGQGEGEEEAGSTVMTAAQKKAAKKEREKKKKEAARQARMAQQNKQEKIARVNEDSTNSSANVNEDTGGDKVDSTQQVRN